MMQTTIENKLLHQSPLHAYGNCVEDADQIGTDEKSELQAQVHLGLYLFRMLQNAITRWRLAVFRGEATATLAQENQFREAIRHWIDVTRDKVLLQGKVLEAQHGVRSIVGLIDLEHELPIAEDILKKWTTPSLSILPGFRTQDLTEAESEAFQKIMNDDSARPKVKIKRIGSN